MDQLWERIFPTSERGDAFWVSAVDTGAPQATKEEWAAKVMSTSTEGGGRRGEDDGGHGERSEEESPTGGDKETGEEGYVVRSSFDPVWFRTQELSGGLSDQGSEGQGDGGNEVAEDCGEDDFLTDGMVPGENEDDDEGDRGSEGDDEGDDDDLGVPKEYIAGGFTFPTTPPEDARRGGNPEEDFPEPSSPQVGSMMDSWLQHPPERQQNPSDGRGFGDSDRIVEYDEEGIYHRLDSLGIHTPTSNSSYSNICSSPVMSMLSSMGSSPCSTSPICSEGMPGRERDATSARQESSRSRQSTPPGHQSDQQANDASSPLQPLSQASEYEVLDLRVFHQRDKTGLEDSQEFPIVINEAVIGRYQIVEQLGKAAFCTAVKAFDLHNGGEMVCLKIINNNKGHYDQGLDEIRMLNRVVKTADKSNNSGVVKILDYFYTREHLIIVTELLKTNLYDFQQKNQHQQCDKYFTLGRIKSIARQMLSSLSFLHSQGIIHADLKPENVMLQSYSKCIVKIIDLGSARFTHEQPCQYLQSRSYRAPEVILRCDYDEKIDIWSLGCVLAELYTGSVLFPNESNATLLAQIVSTIGPLPSQLVKRGEQRELLLSRSSLIYEENLETGKYEVFIPKKGWEGSFRERFGSDTEFAEFLLQLLAPEPRWRASAAEALNHPWLNQN